AGIIGPNTVKVSGGSLHLTLPQFSKITLGIVAGATPITWENFSVFAKDQKGLLSWTAEITNVQSFTIESSCDGVQFQPIGNVKATSKTSGFTDEIPLSKI